MGSNKDRVLIELERIQQMADTSYITGGGWTTSELLNAIREKAEKVERLLDD